MGYREESLGQRVRFLLPSLKLKQPGRSSPTIERDVHEFLVETFGGYTASSATLFGYWKNEGGENSYGEHREFTVGLSGDDKLPVLKSFLGDIARQMREESLYLEVAGQAFLIFGS